METGNVFEVEENSSRNVVDMVFEGEVIFKDDSEVADVSGGG